MGKLEFMLNGWKFYPTSAVNLTGFNLPGKRQFHYLFG